MSEYKASPPVIARTIVPKIAIDTPWWLSKKFKPYIGFNAFNIEGLSIISSSPKYPIVANHTNIIGPKNAPILVVPNFSIANKIETSAIEI